MEIKKKTNATFYRSKNCGGSCPTHHTEDSASWLSESIKEKNAEIVIRDHNGKEILRDRMSKKKKMQEIFQKQTIKRNDYMEKQELTKEEKDFLCLPEADVICLAASIKQTAIDNKDCADSAFMRAIILLSNGAIAFAKHPNGRQVNFSKCKLFRMTHAKKHPGRISYEKIDETIVKIHKEAGALIAETGKGNLTLPKHKRTASDLIDQVINAIAVHYWADSETRTYLATRGINLDNDISGLTNNTITVKFDKNVIHLTTFVGRTMTVHVAEEMPKDRLKRILKDALQKLLLSLALSSAGRDAVSMVFDVETAEDLIFHDEINVEESTESIVSCQLEEQNHTDANGKKSVKVFTAFSGYDSQCMALERLKEAHPGFEYELVGWSEIDKKAIASHNAAFPEFANCYVGDITKIDWSSVPDFDLFTYSSPCQSFSAAGKREGGEKGSGTKSSLLWECQRAIQSKRPKYCIFENVKGLVDKTMYHTLEDWQLTMCKMGYVNYWQVLDAHDYGLPQHRERLVMVSIRIDDWTEIPNYSFPNPIPCDKRPEDLLDDDSDEKCYLSAVETEAFLDILRNGNEAGFEAETNFRGKEKKRKNLDNSKVCKKFVTPLCRDGSVPTLTASGVGNVITMYSTGDRPAAGVVEIRKHRKIKK